MNKKMEFYKISFSSKENDIIKKFSKNIIELGLLDASFIYDITGREQFKKQAEDISRPLAFSKKGEIKFIRYFPAATKQERQDLLNNEIIKYNLLLNTTLSAENYINFEDIGMLKGVNSAVLFPNDGGFFRIEYSSFKKDGPFNLIKRDPTIDYEPGIADLTNMEKDLAGTSSAFLRRAKNCSYMFQFSKMLLYNQTLFEKNIFRSIIEDFCRERDSESEFDCISFLNKIENIYNRFENDSKGINNMKFNFIKNMHPETAEISNIDLSKCNFKFYNRFKKNFFNRNKAVILNYLIEEEDGYHIYFEKEACNFINRNILKEIGDFIKFYLLFCCMLQNSVKELVPELLSKNI